MLCCCHHTTVSVVALQPAFRAPPRRAVPRRAVLRAVQEREAVLTVAHVLCYVACHVPVLCRAVQEREVVMLTVAHDLAVGQLAQAPPDPDRPLTDIVLVAGSAHLDGGLL